MLRNKCASKREEVTGDWRRMYIEELHGLYSSPLYDQIKEKERSGACRTYGKKRRHAEAWWGNLKERDQVEDLGIDMTI